MNINLDVCIIEVSWFIDLSWAVVCVNFCFLAITCSAIHSCECRHLHADSFPVIFISFFQMTDDIINVFLILETLLSNCLQVQARCLCCFLPTRCFTLITAGPPAACNWGAWLKAWPHSDSPILTTCYVLNWDTLNTFIQTKRVWLHLETGSSQMQE